MVSDEWAIAGATAVSFNDEVVVVAAAVDAVDDVAQASG